MRRPPPTPEPREPPRPRLLPRLVPIGTPGYYVLLGAVAIFILGPLGGVTAAYMNFSIGFFVGGQVLAGILGSTVTYFYGPEGKHGANYMQTMAASVASMSAMGVLIQAMVWLGMSEPPAWKLILYFMCIGMFGVGVGMLYTPILVDRLKLPYPSGLAVANILRALTDPGILRQSVGKLVGGTFAGAALAKFVETLRQVYDHAGLSALNSAPKLGAISSGAFKSMTGFNGAIFGGGMIVGARVTAAGALVAGLGLGLTPWLRAHDYLGPLDPFRKIGFIFALGTILGAAIVDMSLLARDALARAKMARTEAPDLRHTPVKGLIVWVACWGTALVVMASQTLDVPAVWLVVAIGASFFFLLVNGISNGMTDQNPISSAFVVSVLLMSFLGLSDPLVGLFAGSVLLVSCTVGVDMQQDRSTGWRLGSSRRIQFRYQVIGIVMGAVLAVLMTRVFLESYPVLKQNAFEHPELRETTEGSRWQSAMTFKFVGVLKAIAVDKVDDGTGTGTDDKQNSKGASPGKTKMLWVMALGTGVGLIIEVFRNALRASAAYQAWKVRSRAHGAADFVVDALLIASPYASSIGGFVEFTTALWFALGGICASSLNWLATKRKGQAQVHAAASPGEGAALPEDMSTTSLVGGGLIAGDSLFALCQGLHGLVSSGALGKILGGG